jgi:hypothetical protein
VTSLAHGGERRWEYAGQGASPAGVHNGNRSGRFDDQGDAVCRGNRNGKTSRLGENGIRIPQHSGPSRLNNLRAVDLIHKAP